MSAERFVADARATLATLLGTGAVSSTKETVARARASRGARGPGPDRSRGPQRWAGTWAEEALAFVSIALAVSLRRTRPRQRPGIALSPGASASLPRTSG
jgi:hypothetical protein